MALSNAERQRRFRERQKAQGGKPKVVYRDCKDRRSRPARWHDAVETLIELQDEYRDWHEALPDALRETPTGEALDAIFNADLDSLAEIEPPRGFGRD